MSRVGRSDARILRGSGVLAARAITSVAAGASAQQPPRSPSTVPELQQYALGYRTRDPGRYHRPQLQVDRLEGEQRKATTLLWAAVGVGSALLAVGQVLGDTKKCDDLPDPAYARADCLPTA